MTNEPSESAQSGNAVESIELAAPEILELVCAQLAESAEGLSAALEACVSIENDNMALLEASENYTTQVQDIWEIAEQAGLTGLQEVCTFVNDNWMTFSLQNQAQKQASQGFFEQWPLNVFEYLQEPIVAAPRLVSFMQESGWPMPLDVEPANSLLTLLTKPTTSEELLQPEPLLNEEECVAEVDRPSLEMEVMDKISLGSAQILEMLSDELESAKEDLATEVEKFITDDAEFVEASENYTEQVQRLAKVSEQLGLEGLQTVCSLVISNVTALGVADTEARLKAKQLLGAWPDLVLAYLRSPNDSVIPLVNHFREPEWAQPLADDAAHTLLAQLTAGSTDDEKLEEQAYSRQTTAHPEDVSLTIPEDVKPELLEAYLQEIPQNTADLSASLQKIIKNPEISEIECAKRIAHTLKGSSNILGIKGIANIGHHLEDTFEYLAEHKVAPPKELADTMVEAADCLEIMVEALLGQDEPPPQAQQVLQSVLDWANRIDKGNLEAPASPPSPPPVSNVQTETDKTAEGVVKQTAAGTPEQSLRVPTKTIDELMRLVSELSISVEQIKDKFKHLMQSTHSLSEQNLILQRRTFELEDMVDVRGITGVESSYQKALKTDKNFDTLELQEYNELHTIAHSFIESIADNRELAMSIRNDIAELESMFVHQELLNKDFQANIMMTRMVPVSNLVAKLQRNVRQTCRMTGKQAELILSGTDIMIDSDVLNNLADPLQHILRNAIDHGIETAEERDILTKPEAGKIKLSFYRQGNNIVVKCEDDGHGLNYTNIRYTAIQRRLITENQEVTEKELARLILLSGFSTKSGVTKVSGRGVGMDVVHTNIRQMKGTLDLNSETGKGTTILIKLPMTLVTVHVLLVRVGKHLFGISTNYLEQALAAGVGEISKVGNEITLKLDKNMYALKYLANLLNIPGDRLDINQQETSPIILVHEETGITAVAVDELLDTHDLVMKSLGKYVSNIHGIAGASILGDGSLVPLLDLPELLRSPMLAARLSSQTQHHDEQGASTAATTPRIMIVDDSIAVRKALSMLVEEAGFETISAKDGVEAIEIMEREHPSVMLVDLEMPRMNGLELAAHVRANQATQKLPIFMITSRTTEKHRVQAKAAGVDAYITKPYKDSDLLNLIDQALQKSL